MAGSVFPFSVSPKSFDGTVLLSVDGGTTTWAFPGASIQISDTDNIGRPDAIDASAISHIEVPGVRMGSLSFAAYLMPDRSVDTFLNAAFGQRTNQQLAPFIYTLIPNNGAAPIMGTGVWFSRVTIAGSFGTSGQQAMNLVRLSAIIIDVDNFYAAAALAPPALVGLNGLGASSFDNSSFTNGTALAYDKIRSYSLTFDNQLSIIPGIANTGARIAAGCQPGTLRGALTLEQLQNPANPLPGVRGQYPITLKLPTGDGSKKLVINTNVSRDGSTESLVPTDFNARGQLYSVFGTNAATGGWLFSASYV